MINEPLKNKVDITPDQGNMYFETDVLCAIEWLKEKQTEFVKNYKNVKFKGLLINLIDEVFPDLKEG